jgi:hypothetical protein
MKTKVQIGFDAQTLPADGATILDATGCGSDVADVHDYTIHDIRTVKVRLTLDKGDPRIAKVLALLEQYGIKADVVDYPEYSDEDLETAQLLWMSGDIDQSVDTGYQYGTKYDLSQACPNCNAGARQTSALYIDGEELRLVRSHRAIEAFNCGVLVDGGIAKKLRDAGVRGISFGEVRARLKNKKWSLVAREQILIEHTMPPVRSSPTEDDTQQMCKVCRRGGWINIPKKPYRAEDLVGMQDFNVTWEWFGPFWPEDLNRGIYSRYAKWPHPRIVVTPKVMNIFRDAGVTTFEWTPVTIGD